MNEWNRSESFVLLSEDVQAFERYLLRNARPLAHTRIANPVLWRLMWRLGIFTFEELKDRVRTAHPILWLLCHLGMSAFLLAAWFLALVTGALSGRFVWIIFGYWLACVAVGVRDCWERWKKWRALTQPAQRWKLGPWQVVISPEGVRQESNQATLFHHWSAIWEIDRTRQHVFFLIGETEAIIVPHAAFPSDEAFGTFFEQATRYYEQAELPVAEQSEQPVSGEIMLPEQALTTRSDEKQPTDEERSRITRREQIQDHA